MSTGTRVPLAEAYAIATDLRGRLRPGCHRIEIAGSIRRERPDVGDIELVAEPILRPERNLFDEQIGQISVLDEWIGVCLTAGILERHPDDPKDGERYKKLVHRASGLQLDLFIVREPATFGVLFAIRTGPARYSQWLVTYARRQGFHVVDGALHVGSLDCGTRTCPRWPTPGEESVFEALRLPYPQPTDRVA
jgi:DNA polymerase/3'-5' exonuclease PolX